MFRTLKKNCLSIGFVLLVTSGKNFLSFSSSSAWGYKVFTVSSSYLGTLMNLTSSNWSRIFSFMRICLRKSLFTQSMGGRYKWTKNQRVIYWKEIVLRISVKYLYRSFLDLNFIPIWCSDILSIWLLLSWFCDLYIWLRFWLYISLWLEFRFMIYLSWYKNSVLYS